MLINTNYNLIPKSNISNNNKTTPNFSFGTSPQMKNDSFEIQHNNKLSSKQKLGIGLGICALALAGVGLAILTRGKFNEVKLKQLAEHIDFVKAETLEDAINWGKKHLDIKSYEGFTEKDLDVINWINEGLTNVSNYKNGKLKIPDVMRYVDADMETIARVVKMGKKFGNVLEINKNYIENIDKSISNFLKERKFKYEYFEESSLKNILTNIENFKNNKMTNLNDKLQLFEDLKKLDREQLISSLRKMKKLLANPEIKQKLIDMGILKEDILELYKGVQIKVNINQIEEYDQRILDIIFKTIQKESGFKFVHESANPFRTIYHEMGHLQYKPISKGTGKVEFRDRLAFWNRDIKAMNTAYTVSDYAATSPSEFVAEVFAEKVCKNKLTVEAEELFNKLVA